MNPFTWQRLGQFCLQAVEDPRYTVARYHSHAAVDYTAWFKPDGMTPAQIIQSQCGTADAAKQAAEAHRANSDQ